MGNETYVSCLDVNLSRHSVNPEYWNTRDISSSSRVTGILTASTMLSFLLIGLPSNVLIILIILLRRLYEQPTEILLLSLAIADLLTCVLVLPQIIVAGFAGEFIFGDSDYVRCKVCQSGIVFVGLTVFTVHVLALMSLDRCMYIRLPLRYGKIITKKTTVVSVVLVSLLSVLFSIFPLFGFGDIAYDLKTFSCSPNFDHETLLVKNIYYMVLLISEALVPLSILIITNTWVLCIAHKQMKAIYKIQRSIKNAEKELEFSLSIRNRLRQEKYHKQFQLTRAFGAIFISNIITWSPVIIRVIEVVVKGSDDFPLWSNFIIIVSIVSHSVIHPIIQACLIPDIRKDLCVCCSKSSTCQSSSSQCCNSHNCLDILNVSMLPHET